MIDATHLKAHRTACSLAKKGAVARRIGRTKGGLNSKLHALCDEKGRPIVLCLSQGQLSDHVGAKLIYPAIPNANVLIGDKGYDSDEFRDALRARKIKACIPPRQGRSAPRSYSKTLYKQRHRIENMFAKLKDWRRIATRYDRCAHTFMSSICIAATVIFWINQ
jgi:transposase